MLNTDGDKRIVLLGSSATSSGVWDPNNLHGDSGYSRLKFYGNSKLYMVSRDITVFIYIRPGHLLSINAHHLTSVTLFKPRC